MANYSELSTSDHMVVHLSPTGEILSEFKQRPFDIHSSIFLYDRNTVEKDINPKSSVVLQNISLLSRPAITN